MRTNISGSATIRDAILQAGMKNCAVSEITLAEIMTGAYKGGIEKHMHEIAFIKLSFKIIPISDHLETYSRLRSYQEKRGEPLDSSDLLLGATAVDRGLAVVSHNPRHLGRIPGIQLIDWEI